MQRRPPALELPFRWIDEEAEPGAAPASPAAGLRRPERLAPAAAGPRSRPEVRPPAERPAEEAPLSVGELDRRLKRLVEGGLGEVRVEGEVADLKEPGSGHAYFLLKDGREDASIDCVMYRLAPPRSRRLLANGARVVLIGRPTVYAQRGRLQLVAEEARPAGRGALLEALERLKEKLGGEGLFAPERKRPLPRDPRVVGVVTSADGAAIHDIVKVAARRSPVRIVLARAAVQGPNAAAQMARALQLLGRHPDVEVVILGRGGGSADDLGAFNDELLVRAVAAMRVPVVSAVGHEVDVTLTDLVADARASTPSQAAELVVPDAVERLATLAQLRTRLGRAMTHRLRETAGLLAAQRRALEAPGRILGERQQGLDEALARLEARARQALGTRRAELARVERRLSARHPSAVLASARASVAPLSARLDAALRRRLDAAGRRLDASAAGLAAAMGRRLEGARRDLARGATRLDALSPLQVLGRGYAIATGPSGRAVRSAAELRPGDALRLRLHLGSVAATVTSVSPASEAGGARTKGAEGSVDD